ncbi:MAG: DEAD/DEAH box helicase [Chloroflexi bacterium]|nr:DEAD/DEAH box helicase [Chloroflexota bacterium]
MFPFQADGARALVRSDALLLADDMGLGKTVQAIAALRRLAASGDLGNVLLVVPSSLIAQWRMQLYEWAPELRFSTVRGSANDRAWQWRTPADIYIVGYETLRSDFSLNPHSPVGREWGVVVLDEAQRIKNRESDISGVCKGLRRRRAWALTGTPLENQLDDVASVLEFVQPHVQPGDGITLRSEADVIERLRAVLLRRRKAEVLRDLPPKLTVPVPLELGRRQRHAYDLAEREGLIELRALGAKITITHVLELIMRLKQICNFCPVTGESAKLEDLTERLDAVAREGHRALVFSQFVKAEFGVEELGRRLARFRPLIYSGESDASVRERTIARFRADESHKAMLLSLRAGGQGLNLQEASYVFHFDRWWNPAVERQAEDRAHRLGQENPVFVYTYTCIDTIEERIETILASKQELFDVVIDGDLTSALSADELFGAVGLQRPR